MSQPVRCIVQTIIVGLFTVLLRNRTLVRLLVCHIHDATLLLSLGHSLL